MRKKILLLISVAAALFASACSENVVAETKVESDTVELKNTDVRIKWTKTDKGWALASFSAKSGGTFAEYGKPSGEYAVIYAAEKPSEDPLEVIEDGERLKYPEPIFKYIMKAHNRSISAVSMNRAGEYDFFLPTDVELNGNALVFKAASKFGKYTATWSINEKYPSDIDVAIVFEPNKDGYYSLPTPTLATLDEKSLKWGVVPGWYQGGEINKKFHLAYEYAQGLPEYPTICRESTITTMSSLMENKKGVTLAVTPLPGQDRNAFEKDKSTHQDWKVGLSHMNKHSQLTPTAYHPVLGEKGSLLKAGEKSEFNFTITLKKENWYAAYKHAIYDIYNLKYALTFKDTKQSLTDRVIAQQKYCLDDKTSYWNVEDFNGVKIGAQSYLGGVHEADKDAMKNSDIGAVWMLANISGDEALKKDRLPYIRNFKVQQQQTEPGFFQGAAKGQYYLAKKKKFVEEWGTHFEPIGLTYYTMMDIGNILLFEPKDKELKDLLRLGADKLMQWQKEDGSWEVAYDLATQKPIYTDLTDLRPTFYGLVIAYRILGDSKYLAAAEKGADWYVKNAVEKGHFLGVCGDVRFVNDFATAQSAQALMDLYGLDGDKKYLDAAKKVSEMYTTSIYTHPIPTNELKTRKAKIKVMEDGKEVEKEVEKKAFDWQLNQIGLCFEHGGSMGSAVGGGPILLLSHCGQFVRMYQQTGDELFLDLARAGALGRDAFVNPETRVASYYWSKFDNGSGPFPHHAWWQIGWIMDYLVAEAEMRSDGEISFPRGFITPKVGPHVSLGFAPGKINGEKCNLVLMDGLVSIDNPNIDYLTATSLDGKKLFVILMNDQTKHNTFNVTVNSAKLGWIGMDVAGNNTLGKGNVLKQSVEAFGIKILTFTKR